METVEVRGDSVLIASTDSDAVARHLLTTTDARDLEITSRGLEDAFISLTTEGDRGMTTATVPLRPSGPSRPSAGSTAPCSGSRCAACCATAAP